MLSLDKIEKIIEYYQLNKTNKQISQELNVSVWAVDKYIRLAGLSKKIRRKNVDRILYEEERCVNRVYGTYCRSSKRRDLEFNLTKDQVKKLIFNKCFYCGLYKVNIGRKDKFNRDLSHNGIDRIDNSLGYFVENVVSCCGICNSAKSKRRQEDFITWINLVYNNLNIKNNL